MGGAAVSREEFARGRNGSVFALDSLSELPASRLVEALANALEEGGRLVAYFGLDAGGGLQLVAVVADDQDGELAVGLGRVEGRRLASLAERFPQAERFEREIAEQWGVELEGHPWNKPVRYAPPLGSRLEGSSVPVVGVAPFYAVAGEEVHEVGVGPVHAGVIEPGHFRFQCHGETVFHLEIALGYQHRGIERALLGGPGRRSLAYAETAAGDTTIGHGTAYCEVLEALAGCQVSIRAQRLRAVALELERTANHVGDLGALAGDVAFLPTASYCGRLRGEYLNLTAELCGNRFGRGLLVPGGVRFDPRREELPSWLERLEQAFRDTRSAVELMWDSASVMARFERIGTVPGNVAEALGIRGPAARASGLERDVRHDHPSGAYRFQQIPVSTADSGDVFARAYVRWLEVQRSVAFVRDQLEQLSAGPVRSELGTLAPRCLAVVLVEGWRGELAHVAVTDGAGRFARYKVVDPSFLNWSALAWALRGGQISDFPLCNKSFNLSYCGHDL